MTAAEKYCEWPPDIGPIVMHECLRTEKPAGYQYTVVAFGTREDCPICGETVATAEKS